MTRGEEDDDSVISADEHLLATTISRNTRDRVTLHIDFHPSDRVCHAEMNLKQTRDQRRATCATVPQIELSAAAPRRRLGLRVYAEGASVSQRFKRS